MKIDKSPAARQKEKQIAELERQIQRIRTTLKSLKTRLSNTQSRIETVQRDAFSKISRIQERIANLLSSLEQLAGRLRKDKRLKRQDKDYIDEVYQGLVKELKNSLPDFEAMTADRRNEEAEARFRDAFREFRVAPPAEEQRDIRKLYLSLSKQFHPDRARGETEKEQYHQLQQQINEAYQSNDFQTLTDLEQLWGEPPEQPATIDALDAKISRLTHQLHLLQQQKERLSQEIKQLRDSDMGRMLTQHDGLERAGITLENSLPMRNMERMAGMLEKLQEVLEETDRKGKMSPRFFEVMEELARPEPTPMQMLADMLGLPDDDDLFPDFELYDDDYDEEGDYSPNPNPRFPVGTAVRIAKNRKENYLDENSAKRTLSLRDLSGIVTEAYLDFSDLPIYSIELDIASMKRLPDDYIRVSGRYFNLIEELDEQALVKHPQRPESPGKVMRVYRELLYRRLLSELPPDQQTRLRSVLLANPGKSDERNWLAYLEAHLTLPFTARTRGRYQGFTPGRRATVTESLGYSPEDGFIVLAKIGREEMPLPLAELAGTDKGPVAQLLDDYGAWWEVYFEW